MSDPVRLARRVIELTGCSRADAEQYIKGGWVSVDGAVVEDPAFRVITEAIEVDPAAQLALLGKSAGKAHAPSMEALVDALADFGATRRLGLLESGQPVTKPSDRKASARRKVSN